MNNDIPVDAKHRSAFNDTNNHDDEINNNNHEFKWQVYKNSKTNINMIIKIVASYHLFSLHMLWLMLYFSVTECSLLSSHHPGYLILPQLLVAYRVFQINQKQTIREHISIILRFMNIYYGFFCGDFLFRKIRGTAVNMSSKIFTECIVFAEKLCTTHNHLR